VLAINISMKVISEELLVLLLLSKYGVGLNVKSFLQSREKLKIVQLTKYIVMVVLVNNSFNLGI